MPLSELKFWVNKNNLVLIFIFVYFLFSIIKIENPGVNNDQLMFVNTATLHPDNFFLWKSWHGVPMMVFPYIGALKSYLYMPIFYFFGVNIWSIRLPQIMIICLTWILLYRTLTLAFSKKIALITILLLSLDPSIIVYSKVDQGPTVLEFFFKVLALYLFFLFVSTKKIIFFFAVFPVLALGIFNKLNFIWFVNAFILSSIIFYNRLIYNVFKKFGRLTPFIVLTVPYFLLIKIFLRISKEVSLSYRDFADPVAFTNVFQNFSVFYSNLTNIINGNIFFKVVYGENPTPAGIYFSIFVLLILLRGTIKWIGKYKLSSKPHGLFLLTILVMVFQLLMTKKAISAWHALAIYPLFTVLLATAVLQIKRAHLLLAIIIFYFVTVNYLYISKYSQPAKGIAYTSKIYDLIDFAKINKAKFICLDVDICNQLLSFNQEVNKYKEPFFYLDPPTYNYSFIKLLGNFKNPDNYLYVSHGDSTSHFPDLKKQFFKYLQDNKIAFMKVKEFKDGNNIAFEVFKIGI